MEDKTQKNKEYKNLHSGHRERMYRKFCENGLDGFNEYEILEFLLYYALPRRNTNDIAHMLLDEFGSLNGVLNASVNQLKKIKGIGETAAVFLKLIPELSKIYYKSLRENIVLDSCEKVCNYFIDQYAGEYNEKVMLACLDDQLKLIRCKTLIEGTPSRVNINIRKLVQFTYENNSETVIIAHNHPNGEAIPSDADIKATSSLYSKLKGVGINLIDHIIVAKGKAISFSDEGILGMII